MYLDVFQTHNNKYRSINNYRAEIEDTLHNILVPT